ncbi:MAG: hypothetical protein J6P60_01190 [Lachnospiraceae bacterium]|nr:hypothetical protein [Lachnospiraceae bacterium]
MRRKRDAKASVTVYLALVFAVLISLLFTVIENVRSQAAMMSLECSMDLALYSVFAEFHRELLEQYDLFFIDTGYGELPSTDHVAGHLKGYLEDNFDLSLEDGAITPCDFLQMHVEQTEITAFCRATDEDGAVFKRQAVAYMKEKYGISYLEELGGRLESCMRKVDENRLLARDVEAERGANRQRLEAVEIPPKKISETEYEEVRLENPADAVPVGSAGILHLVVEDVSALSKETIHSGSYVSGRTVGKGSGLMGRDRPSKAEDLWYHEYLLDKCSFYTEPLQKAKLRYQAEYVIAGRDSDVENLKWVAGRLLFIREAANVVHLFSDSGKMAQAELAASAIAAILRAPDLLEPLKYSILFAWAYAESIYDVKQLLSGGKVPQIKDVKSWHYSLEGMLNFQSDLSGDPGPGADDDPLEMEESGLSYKDYLRILLLGVPERDSVFRMMDIIEMDIRQTEGNQNFYLDACIDFVRARVYAGSRFADAWVIEREYFYF